MYILHLVNALANTVSKLKNRTMVCRLLAIPLLSLGLHLYSHSNLLKEGKSCCLLGIDASCRKTCFLSTNKEEIRKSCKPKEEVFINTLSMVWYSQYSAYPFGCCYLNFGVFIHFYHRSPCCAVLKETMVFNNSVIRYCKLIIISLCTMYLHFLVNSFQQVKHAVGQIGENVKEHAKM